MIIQTYIPNSHRQTQGRETGEDGERQLPQPSFEAIVSLEKLGKLLTFSGKTSICM